MIKIKLSELDAPVKMERNCIARMKDFIEDERWHSERLLVLYGLPETGKDMLAKQILSYYRNSVKCSVYEVEETDTMEDIYQLLERIQEQDKDRVRQIIWFRPAFLIYLQHIFGLSLYQVLIPLRFIMQGTMNCLTGRLTYIQRISRLRSIAVCLDPKV